MRQYGAFGPPRRPWGLFAAVGCGVVFLVCGGVFATLIGRGVQSINTDIPPATATAAMFLDLIQVGRVDDAYAVAGHGFREQGVEAFRAFVGRYELLTTATARTVNGAHVHESAAGKRVFVQMTLHSPTNAMTCTVVVDAEGGVWRVTGVSVP